MANLYYNERLDDDAFTVGAIVEVTGEEARHAVRVARLRVGEWIVVGNGAGALAHGEVTGSDRDRFAVRISEASIVPQSEPSLVLVQALAKGNRDERAVEQATEFGVDAIAPWQAARSVSRWDGAGGAEKTQKGVAKWARIAREASKQSMRARMPELREPLTTAGLCALAAHADAEVVVLHPRGTAMLSAWASTALTPRAREVYLVVGPEGGFSDDELEALAAAGAKVLQLGEHVLRTSSAGPAGLAVLNVALGRW